MWHESQVIDTINSKKKSISYLHKIRSGSSIIQRKSVRCYGKIFWPSQCIPFFKSNLRADEGKVGEEACHRQKLKTAGCDPMQTTLSGSMPGPPCASSGRLCCLSSRLSHRPGRGLPASPATNHTSASPPPTIGQAVTVANTPPLLTPTQGANRLTSQLLSPLTQKTPLTTTLGIAPILLLVCKEKHDGGDAEDHCRTLVRCWRAVRPGSRWDGSVGPPNS